VVVFDTISERVNLGDRPSYSVALTNAVLGNTTHAPTLHGQGLVAIDTRILVMAANVADTDLLHAIAAFPR
jgi:hypothetical protein